jgi:uncharacterized protein YcnI
MRMQGTRISRLIVLAMLASTVSAFGHVRVSPSESTAGAAQRYTMRVPTERQSPTVGHRVSLESAIRIVLDCTPRYRIPEPLREARTLCKRASR